MKIISVEHSTVYRYDNPVVLEPHTFRLRPRMTTTQRLLEFAMDLQPQPLGESECLDQDGNLTVHTWFQEPVLELRVSTRFRVEMLRQNPFDFALAGASVRIPLWYDEPLASALAPYRSDHHVSITVKRFAQGLAAGTKWNSLEFLQTLTQHLSANCLHMTRPWGPPWTSDMTLQSMSGSCRDLTVLFCDACRVMGIAARFVSGYECAAAGQQNGYMHAWAEVYLPGAGWRGYDPSRGLLVTNAHVAVAAGFNYELAAPVSGTFSGGAGSHMDASLKMDIADDFVSAPPPNPR